MPTARVHRFWTALTTASVARLLNWVIPHLAAAAAIRMRGFQVLRLCTCDPALCPSPMTLMPGGLLGGAAPGAAQGIADAGRTVSPSLPPRRSSVPCRPGDPPPSRPPLLLHPRSRRRRGLQRSAALNPSQ
jgi:hypothetical protein